MKKIALLGDSIRQIGYGPRVPALLGDDYSVWQPNDNCRFALYTLRGMFDWKYDLMGSDVVHWNNGLWDECDLFGDGSFARLDDYIDTMVRIAKILKTYSKTVIFATITPVTDANPYNKNSRIMEMNRLVVPALEKEGVLINDLFGLVYPKLDDYIRKDDNIHLTDAGIEVCAQQVAAAIRAVC